MACTVPFWVAEEDRFMTDCNFFDAVIMAEASLEDLKLVSSIATHG
jgi:hypothetical protein